MAGQAIIPGCLGSYFLDRDGGLFKHILAYLRGEQHILACVSLQAPERLQLVEEARYFQASHAQSGASA